MLKKLLKYDIKWSLRVVSIYYFLGIGFVLLSKLIDLFPESIFFTILNSIFDGIAISMLVSGIINCIIRSWVRLTENFYKDEAYLTHTLPVDIKVHFLSKVISVIIVSSLSVIILAGGLCILYLNKDTIEAIKMSLNILSSSINLSVASLIILLTITLLLELIFIILAGYFGIVYGYSHNQKKIKKTFIYGLSIYFAFTIISLIILMLLSLVFKDIYNVIFTNSLLEFEALKKIIYIAIILYFVYNVLLYYLSIKKLQKGINID